MRAPHLTSWLDVNIRPATNDDYYVPRLLRDSAKVITVSMTKHLCEKLSCNAKTDTGEACTPDTPASYYRIGDTDTYDLQCQPACFHLKAQNINNVYTDKSTGNDQKDTFTQAMPLVWRSEKCRRCDPTLRLYMEKPITRSAARYETRLNDLPTGFSRVTNTDKWFLSPPFLYEINKTYCDYFDLRFDEPDRKCVEYWYQTALDYTIGRGLIYAGKSLVTKWTTGSPFPMPELPGAPPSEIPEIYTLEGWRNDINPNFRVPALIDTRPKVPESDNSNAGNSSDGSSSGNNNNSNSNDDQQQQPPPSSTDPETTDPPSTTESGTTDPPSTTEPENTPPSTTEPETNPPANTETEETKPPENSAETETPSGNDTTATETPSENDTTATETPSENDTTVTERPSGPGTDQEFLDLEPMTRMRTFAMPRADTQPQPNPTTITDLQRRSEFLRFREAGITSEHVWQYMERARVRLSELPKISSSEEDRKRFETIKENIWLELLQSLNKTNARRTRIRAHSAQDNADDQQSQLGHKRVKRSHVPGASEPMSWLRATTRADDTVVTKPPDVPQTGKLTTQKKAQLLIEGLIETLLSGDLAAQIAIDFATAEAFKQFRLLCIKAIERLSSSAIQIAAERMAGAVGRNILTTVFSQSMARAVERTIVSTVLKSAVAVARIAALMSTVVGTALAIWQLFDIIFVFWDPYGYNNVTSREALRDMVEQSERTFIYTITQKSLFFELEDLVQSLLTIEDILDLEMTAMVDLTTYYETLTVNSEGQFIDRGEPIDIATMRSIGPSQGITPLTELYSKSIRRLDTDSYERYNYEFIARARVVRMLNIVGVFVCMIGVLSLALLMLTLAVVLIVLGLCILTLARLNVTTDALVEVYMSIKRPSPTTLESTENTSNSVNAYLN